MFNQTIASVFTVSFKSNIFFVGIIINLRRTIEIKKILSLQFSNLRKYKYVFICYTLSLLTLLTDYGDKNFK